jgi:hypothetical protein
VLTTQEIDEFHVQVDEAVSPPPDFHSVRSEGGSPSQHSAGGLGVPQVGGLAEGQRTKEACRRSGSVLPTCSS